MPEVRFRLGTKLTHGGALGRWRPQVCVAAAAGFQHSVALLGGGPPRMVQHPIGFRASVGGNARFVASAVGAQPLRYQWRHNGMAIPGQTRPVFALDGVSAFDAGDYDVVVANAEGITSSRVATLSLGFDPPSNVRISVQPANGRVISWGSENGGLGQTRVPADLPPAVGIAAAGDASFAVIPTTTEPIIAWQPRDQTVYTGDALRLFAAVFPNAREASYAWFKDGALIPGQTNDVLEVAAATAGDTGRYQMRASNPAGVAFTREALIVAQAAGPAIVSQPTDVETYAGGEAAFQVTAVGSAPLSFQWSFNGEPLPEGRTAALQLGWSSRSSACWRLPPRPCSTCVNRRLGILAASLHRIPLNWDRAR